MAHQVLSNGPARLPGSSDGRSPDFAGHRMNGAFPVAGLPVVQWLVAIILTAHSCGGSHGFGPWMGRPHRVPFLGPAPFGYGAPSDSIDDTRGTAPSTQ